MHLLNESNEQVRVVQRCKWHFLIISIKRLPLVESDRTALQTTEKKLLLTPLLSSLPGNSYRPDMSLLAGTPCWDPRFWQSGSRGSSCSVRCGWTLRRRWMRWFQKRMNGCLDPLALQTLKEKDKRMHVISIPRLKWSFYTTVDTFRWQQCSNHCSSAL